jgi:hypothetical protein
LPSFLREATRLFIRQPRNRCMYVYYFFRPLFANLM